MKVILIFYFIAKVLLQAESLSFWLLFEKKRS